ncbi:Hypothetical predicted protein [Podarcis lilfordi]|uniref:Uncharacterized protein n=1 Tax=Podarcis lilfordi TaxID=74358 RepID=A0AA35L2J2_9SAUR|nr:Hypothetical predicted protein [Podarcis lilfordi]
MLEFYWKGLSSFSQSGIVTSPINTCNCRVIRIFHSPFGLMVSPPSLLFSLHSSDTGKMVIYATIDLGTSRVILITGKRKSTFVGFEYKVHASYLECEVLLLQIVVASFIWMFVMHHTSPLILVHFK